MATTYNPWDVILVTGAHDHVAQHIVDQLLALPAARIRATFPSDVLAKHTYAFYEREKPDVLSRLEAVVVEDPCRAGAFDQVVQGVTHIAHVAAPLLFDIANSDLLKPCSQSTTGILQSCLLSPSVRSVTITTTYEPWHLYMSGSTDEVLAEKAAWKFHSTYEPPFSLYMLLSTRVGGPNILPLLGGADSLSVGQLMILGTVIDGSKLSTLRWAAWVDARDVAKANVNAMLLPDAAGKRWVLSAGQATYSDIADIIKRHFPNLSPTIDKQIVKNFTFDPSPALSGLGLGSYVPLETMIVDMMRQVMSNATQ